MTETPRSIEEASLAELHHLLAWLARREGSRPPVLIGGWAVHALVGTGYLRSIDIDLVLNARDRDSLIHHLVNERGYARRRVATDGWKGATRRVEALGQDIVIDTASYEHAQPFEGLADSLPFALLETNHLLDRTYGPPIRIPTRSLLLLFKSKAAFDRAARLARGPIADGGYTATKLVKDRSDLMALLRHPTDWDLAFLDQHLTRLPFLVDVWQAAVADPDAIQRGGHSPDRPAGDLDRLLDQLGRR